MGAVQQARQRQEKQKNYEWELGVTPQQLALYRSFFPIPAQYEFNAQQSKGALES